MKLKIKGAMDKYNNYICVHNGIVTEVNPLFIKALSPIVVTEFGIITEVNPLFIKASLPIDVTEFGTKLL